MASDELNGKVKKGRVKHSYPQNEIYHRFIHSPEYVYTDKGARYRVSAAGNCLITGDFNQYKSDEFVKKVWSYVYAHRGLAIINREHKQILVNVSFIDKYILRLIHAIPDDYEIFYTNKNITNYDCLTEDFDSVLKLHADFLINAFVETRCSECYRVIVNNKLTLHSDIDEILTVAKKSCHHNRLYKYVDYTQIIEFVNKYRIKSKSWYKERTDETVSILYYKGWLSEYLKVPKPSLKQIVTKTLFTEEQFTILRQKRFYTRYCYGNNIGFTIVKNNWNKPFNVENFNAYCRKVFKGTREISTNYTTWNEAISDIWEKEIKSFQDIEEHNASISAANYAKALEKAQSNENVNEWRENSITKTTIVYKKYISSHKINVPGRWADVEVPVNKRFSNVQLKMCSPNRIITSKNATVSLDGAIFLWKYISNIINNIPDFNPNAPYCITRKDGLVNYKISIYTLSLISYEKKRINDYITSDKFEWCFVIGCHRIYLDDFLDFIHYYHFEDKFGLPVNNSNNNFKILIK